MNGDLPAPPQGGWFHVEVRVPFADTDAAGIVWWGNVLRYVEYAEDVLFHALGRSRREIISVPERIELPRTDVRITFPSPARFDDVLDVALALEQITERRARWLFEIRTKSARRFVAHGGFEVACIDPGTFSARAFPADTRLLLSEGFAASLLRRRERRSQALKLTSSPDG
jgi:YbgC/YbaW family acyl-CoA thioester hydrolase